MGSTVEPMVDTAAEDNNALMQPVAAKKKKKGPIGGARAYKTILPAARVDAFLRLNLKSKRVSAGSSIYATAAVEEVVKTIVETMVANAKPTKKGSKRMGRLDLIRSVRNNPDLSRLFRRYVFAPKGQQIKFDALRLLRKDDREALIKKREEQKMARTAAQKASAGQACDARAAGIPAIDED
jgi:16S rRNA G1207 methylase RsmC